MPEKPRRQHLAPPVCLSRESTISQAKGCSETLKDQGFPASSNSRFSISTFEASTSSTIRSLATLAAGEFQFPYDIDSFDSVLIASVFTHMPLDEIGHYLRELRLVVRPGGKILASVFLGEATSVRLRHEMGRARRVPY